MNTSRTNFKKKLCYCLLALAGCHVQAQDLFFNNYQLAPFATNPGQAGIFHDTWGIVNYKTVTLDFGTKLSTTQAAIFHPMSIGSHRIVFSGGFHSDRISESLTTNGGALGGAISIRLGNFNELSLGTQFSLSGTTIDENYTTDQQFINGVYDPSAISGEAIGNNSSHNFSVNNGLYWQLRDINRHVKAFIGLSHYNATRPQVSYLDSSTEGLPITYKITAGYELLRRYHFTITPTVLGIIRNGEQWLQAGSQFHYTLWEGNSEDYLDDETRIGFGMSYNSNQSVLLSLQFIQPRMKLALNFDIPTGNGFGAARNNALEIAMHYRLSKKKRNEALIVEQEETQKTQALPAEEISKPAEVKEIVPEAIIIPEATQTTELKTKKDRRQESIIELKVEPTQTVSPALSPEEKVLLKKHVRFEIESHHLTKESQAHLDKITVLFKKHTHYNINFIGHTCSLGPLELNKKLSLQRAEKAKSYLISKGIKANRIITIGKGETEPLVENTDPAARELNRRVETEIQQTND